MPPQFQERFKKRQEMFGTKNPVTYDCSALVLIAENERQKKNWVI